MSFNTFNVLESERWQLIDHYLSMVQNLNTQSQNIYTAQCEAYAKLTELIHAARTPHIPIPILNRGHTPYVNNTTSRSPFNEQRSSVPPIPRRARDSPTSDRTSRERTVNARSNRSNSRSGRSRPQTVPASIVSSQNETEEQSPPSVNEETEGSSRLGVPSPIEPITVATEPPSLFSMIRNMENTSNMSTIPITSTTTTSPFTNFIHEFHWTQPSANTMRPFNFMDNVPVFPTTEQISDATRIVPFETVETPNNTQCPITLVPFNSTDLVMQIVHCGHLFDVVHLNGWFRNNVRCPVCRHDIRDAAEEDNNTSNTASTLIPESFVDDGNETDPDMPGLEPVNTLEEENTSDEPTPPSFSEWDTLDLNRNSFNITTPVWSFNNMQVPSSSDTDVPQIMTDIQNVITRQGLNMLSSAIHQTIQETFPPSSDPMPSPDNEPRPANEPSPDLS